MLQQQPAARASSMACCKLRQFQESVQEAHPLRTPHAHGERVVVAALRAAVVLLHRVAQLVRLGLDVVLWLALHIKCQSLNTSLGHASSAACVTLQTEQGKAGESRRLWNFSLSWLP